MSRASAGSYTPDALTPFPYPNYHPKFPNKLRTFAVVSAADLALLRVDGGTIAETTDRLISTRVCSYRLAASPGPTGAWAFQDRGKAWMSFTEQGVEILDRGKLTYMCRTDVTKFYPSVQIDRLQEQLLRSGCDQAAVARVIETLRLWQAFDGLSGLPIGPEASAVLGNFYLDPIDRSIMSAGADHRRYGDDILIFTENQALSKAAVALIDADLASLGLVKSEEKTRYFDDPEEAKRDLRNSKIQYWKNEADRSRAAGRRAARRAFDQEVLNAVEIIPSAFHWILKYMRNKEDGYRCRDLVQREHLMNIDPHLSGSYLSKVAGSDRFVRDECMKRLDRPPQDQLEGLTLHTLRAFYNFRTGKDEARVFERIANDRSRPWPVRATAWKALAHTDGTKPRMLEDAAMAETNKNIRRAIITGLRRFAGDARCKVFLDDVATKYPETRYTVEWVKEAA